VSPAGGRSSKAYAYSLGEKAGEFSKRSEGQVARRILIQGLQFGLGRTITVAVQQLSTVRDSCRIRAVHMYGAGCRAGRSTTRPGHRVANLRSGQ